MTPRSQENHREALEPCPFCGCKDPVMGGCKLTDGGPEKDVWYVACPACNSTFDSEAEATKHWNTRAPSHRAAVVTEEVRKFALECIDGRIDLTKNSLFAWSKSDRPEAPRRIAAIEAEVAKQVAMRAALAAALGGGKGCTARIDRRRFEQAPCYLCGYNGPGYFQSDTHPCAAKYHAEPPHPDQAKGEVRL